MTLHIVPSLSTMVETSLAAILRAKDRRAFERAFDEFVADDASIAMNGQPVARSHYREHLWQEQMGEQAAEVRFKEVVEVPDDAKAVIQTGEVGVFYEATIWVQEGEVQNVIRASVNFVVAKKGHNVLEDIEGRIVTAVNQVSTVRDVVRVAKGPQ